MYVWVCVCVCGMWVVRTPKIIHLNEFEDRFLFWDVLVDDAAPSRSRYWQQSKSFLHSCLDVQFAISPPALPLWTKMKTRGEKKTPFQNNTNKGDFKQFENYYYAYSFVFIHISILFNFT